MPRKDPRLNTPADSVNERIQDATIRHMLYLEGLKTRQANDVLRFLDTEIIPDLKEQLSIRLERHMSGLQTTARLEAMIKQFERITQDFKNINTRVQGELFDIAIYEAEFNLNMLKQQTPVNVNYVLPAPELITTAIVNKPFDGRTLEQWFDSLATSTQTRLASEIRRGVVEGQTSQQIVKRIADANILEVTRAQTNAVVRTAVQHAASSARDELFKANSDIIKEVKWVSTLDSRTSPQCRANDGKIFPLNSGPRPPIHVGCRSSVVPVTKSFRELGIDIDDVSPATRASMNGQVPADITYGEWLRKQPVSVQNDALGVTKAKLFRKGDLPIDRFVSRNGHELTLDELRKRESQAFEKAGIA